MVDRNQTVHVLLVYSLTEHKLIDQQIFDEEKEADEDLRSELAVNTYFEAEKKYRDRTDREIVLIGADSLETIYSTHGSYFRESVALEERSLEELFAEQLADLDN